MNTIDQAQTSPDPNTTKRGITMPLPYETALGRWRSARGFEAKAKAAWDAAQTTYAEQSKFAHSPTELERLPLMEAELAYLRAQDVTRAAEAVLAKEVLTAEVNDGNALALACDPVTLRNELAAGLEEESRIIEELNACRTRMADRIARARAACVQLAERRRVRDLPTPRSLPQSGGAYAGELPPRLMVEALEKAMAETATASSRSNAARADELDREVTRIRASRERALLERERREAEGNAELERRRREREADQKAQAERWASEGAAGHAKVEEERKLAEQHRARGRVGSP